MPKDVLWKAFLQTVTQYRGILGMVADRDGTHRVMFVHGMPWAFKVPFGYSASDPTRGKKFTKFVDCWIAVRIRQQGTGTSIVAALVSPGDWNGGAARRRVHRPSRGRGRGLREGAALVGDQFAALTADLDNISARLGEAKRGRARKHRCAT